jgi:acyl-CoA thioesterase FadM
MRAVVDNFAQRVYYCAMTIIMQPQPLEITLPIVVRTYDIDFAGIVSNIVYIRWLEDLRLQLLAEYFPLDTAMQSMNIAPVLLRTEIDYKRAIRLFDAVQGRMWLAEAGTGAPDVGGRVHRQWPAARRGPPDHLLHRQDQRPACADSVRHPQPSQPEVAAIPGLARSRGFSRFWRQPA